MLHLWGSSQRGNTVRKIRRIDVFLILLGLVAIGFSFLKNKDNIQAQTFSVTRSAEAQVFSTSGTASTAATEERDTLVTLLSIIYDDGAKNLWNATAWVDSFAAYGIVGTISVIAHNALYGDTTNTTLSPARLRALEARGWDIQGHGYTHGDSLWASSGAYAMCEGQTNRTQYMREWTRCMAAFDTLGLRTPRGFSWPWSGGNQVAKEEAIKAGFDYGFASPQTATNGIRYCYNTELERVFGSRYIAAYPGLLPDRYEIGQCIGDANTLAEDQSTIKRGLKARGSWIVYIGHSPQSWETTNAGHGFGEFLRYVVSLRDQGLLRIVTAREGYELMFETPVGPAANYMYPNLPDMDGDNQPDFVDTARDSIEIGLGANTFTSAGTRDSVFVSASRPNHGVMGCGYIMTAQNGKYNRTDLKGYTSATGGSHVYPWMGRDFQLKHVNFAEGKTMVVEFWCQVDTTIQHALPSTSDTVAVTFEAWDENIPNRYGASGSRKVPDAEAENADLQANGWVSYLYLQDMEGSSPGAGWTNYSVFSSVHIVGNDWLHVQATWDIPEWAHYVNINIVQDSSFKNKALWLSNFFVGARSRTGE